MTVRFAFAGFRHGHIMSLLGEVNKAEDAEVTAACEEHAATRAQLAEAGTVTFTHDSIADMIADSGCDVVAIGDYYGNRGAIAIQALEAGKHVIADKPICTSLEELDRMETLARDQGLSIGCQLDMRSNPTRMTMRKRILAGEIGDVLTVSFSGQHPLMLGTRPDWYFEEGKHGGTINDIAIHAMDWIPWMTGRDIVEVVAARAWNGKASQFPHFQDCAQMMLKLDNGGGVLGDVSYLMPDSCGYKVRQYWRITVHGSEGMMETQCGDPNVFVATHADSDPRSVPGEHDGSNGYFRDFMNEVQGCADKSDLTTALVVRAARLALTVQNAADTGKTQVATAKTRNLKR
jgi:predicted dehydrogenase